MDILTLMPQRPDGVRATLEFVFASHPSSTVRTSEAADPQKQGANITLEALKMATGLLATPPASVSPEEWFSGIAPQLFDLLDGNQGPDLVKAAAYVIGYGILGRKQFGAPGMDGIGPPLQCVVTHMSDGRFAWMEAVGRTHAGDYQPFARFSGDCQRCQGSQRWN